MRVKENKYKEKSKVFTNEEELKPVDSPIPYKDKMRIRELYASLPVYSATPTHKAIQGEVVLVDDESSTREICAYLNGTWYCSSLT